MTQLQQARQSERFTTSHDSLTGLANREALNKMLDRALLYAARHGKQIAVLILDLDQFKYINDNVGRSAGDELLKQVAKRITSELRRTDGVSRIGGNEFAVMIPDMKCDQSATVVARKLLKCLSRPYTIGGHEYWISASLGIAAFPHDGEDRETLVRRADAAMYQAKAQGKNGYRFYSQSLHEAATKRLTMERQLRRAFEDNELQIHYQPIVDGARDHIVAAEALLRWENPELGVVSPAEFVPLAEETQLIRPIGAWVLRRACAEAQLWHQAGFSECRVCVNVSPRQIWPEGLREAVLRALWETSLDPSALVVEITESSLMEDSENTLAGLRDLKGAGIRIGLDDFGTGFSSLSYLKRLPVDIVKIDSSFVRDIVVDPDDAAIVAAVLSIVEKLRLQVVAEGVETEEQRSFLTAQGCHMMQGHLFGPAVPGDALLKLLQKQGGRDRSS